MGVLEHVGLIARRVIDRMPLARHLAELKTVAKREGGGEPRLLGARVTTQRFLRRPPANDNGERPYLTRIE